jgi:Ca2+-binding RTX toxin-like protein
MPDYIGTAGNDVIVADQGSGRAQGLEGDDRITAVGSGQFTLDGGLGNDTLYGASSRDSLSGGDGNDFLEGGIGQDTYSGGAGVDTFNWAATQAGLSSDLADTIVDWSPEDRLSFANGLVAGGGYLESTSNAFGARGVAETAIRSGTVNFVVVAVGSDLYVFADSLNNNGDADDLVIIRGRTLADIDASNFVAAAAAEPTRPQDPATGSSNGLFGTVSGNLDALQLGALIGSDVIEETPTHHVLEGEGFTFSLTGTGFVYDSNVLLIAGTITGLSLTAPGLYAINVSISGGGFPAASFDQFVVSNATQPALTALFARNDRVFGLQQADLLRTFAGDDDLDGRGGADSLYGGQGNDIIHALRGSDADRSTASTFLRGEEGNDYIIGAAGFDDMHGNQGDDTVAGAAGDDWVVGGQANDLLFGDAGADLVYGNLGDDSCVGGTGADILRGGQGNDLLWAGDGNDFVSGDRGDDTVAGGLGADIFHGSQDAGIDRVVDFNAAQADRVQLDPGTTYTLRQSGADTIIDMGGGHQMVLVGVQLTSLPAGWIFGA